MRFALLFLAVFSMATAPIFAQAPASAPPAEKEKAKGPPPTDPWSALIRGYLDEADPVFVWVALVPLSAMRFFALYDLFNSVPQAVQAARTLLQWRFNAAELKRVKEAIRETRKSQPGIYADFNAALAQYGERMHQLDILLREIGEVRSIKNNQHVKLELDNAIAAWRERGDMGPLLEWFRRNRSGRLRHGDAGSWAQRFESWLRAERRDAEALINHGNRFTEMVNRGLNDGERLPTFSLPPADAHQPGRFAVGGANMSSADLADTMSRRCEQAMVLLSNRRADLRGRVGLTGLLNQGHKILTPLGTVALSGGVFWLQYKAYARTLHEHGKSPDAARAEIQRRATIENEINTRAETSLDSQVKKAEREFQDFTKRVSSVLQDNVDEIMLAVKEFRRQHPDTNVDLRQKRQMLMSEKDLQYHILQAIPFAAQRLARDPSVPQLMSFLMLATKDDETRKKAETSHKRFLNALVTRAIDDMFPELESVIDVDDNPVTVGAGHYLPKSVRNQIVEETLRRMREMRLPENATVAPLPVLPQPTQPADPPPRVEPPRPKGDAPKGNAAANSRADAGDRVPSDTPAVGLPRPAPGAAVLPAVTTLTVPTPIPAASR